MSIKGHALADFLLEIPGELQQEVVDMTRQGHLEEKSNQQWTLYMDGASRKEDSGTRLILTSPTGEEITYALRFDFHISKNAAEYEALLSSL